jgi:DNA (cytosine-5)-methyltransferase 1
LGFVRRIRPRAVVIENVGGMESYRGGEALRKVLRGLASEGYNSQVYKLNAVDFGVPQRRKRLFVIGVRRSRLPAEIPRPRAPRPTVDDALRDLPRLANGNVQDAMPYRLHGAALSDYQQSMRNGTDGLVRNCSTSSSTPLVLRRFAAIPQGGNWEHLPARLFRSYSEPANCHRWLYKRLREDEQSVTIGNFRKNMLIHPWEDRTLSVREAARLQGIHDGFVFFGNLQSQQQQVANAVPPQMAKAVVNLLLQIMGE